MAAPDPERQGWTLEDGTQLIRQLGQGKFARVFEARAPDGAPIAVKILQRKDAQSVRRFRREIKVMRELPANPNCVAYRAHGELPGGAPWVAMELVEGFALSAITRAGKRLPLRTTCALIAQVCDGFQGLHSLGLTHRDITPDNILITRRDRQVKIIDFGLVQDSQGLLSLFEQEDFLEGWDFRDDLDTGFIAGTPEYMAPEQISDPQLTAPTARRTDTTADVFALGVVFHQLLTGSQLFPYARGSGGETGSKGLLSYLNYRGSVRDEDITCPEQADAEVWSIVRKALRRDPKQRQGGSSELARDLRYYLETGRGVLDDDNEKTAVAHRPYTEAIAPSVMSPDDFERVQALATDVAITPIADDPTAPPGETGLLRAGPPSCGDPGVDQDQIETWVDDQLPPTTRSRLRKMMADAAPRRPARAHPESRGTSTALKLVLVLVTLGGAAAFAALIVEVVGGG